MTLVGRTAVFFGRSDSLWSCQEKQLCRCWCANK